jgi:hypothetical protein
MKWLLLLYAIGPGDVYREFPDATKVPLEQLANALRAENEKGEASLALVRSKKLSGPIRIFYGSTVLGPGGRILSPRPGSSFKDDPSIRFDAEGTPELWAFYEANGSAWHKISPEWDTKWVPDQRQGSIKLQLRMRRDDGLWAVARWVEDLTLERKKVSVKLFQAGHPGADALKGATEAAWLVGEAIFPVPVENIGAAPEPGAALLVRYAR